MLWNCDIFVGGDDVSATPALNDWLSEQVFEFLGVGPGLSQTNKAGHSDTSCEWDGPHWYIESESSALIWSK
jgi:hypothetical protein